MKDGLQNVPIDRWLMRVKDICSILSSIGSMLIQIVAVMWIAFKFIETQNKQQEMLNTLLQNQMNTKK